MATSVAGTPQASVLNLADLVNQFAITQNDIATQRAEISSAQEGQRQSGATQVAATGAAALDDVRIATMQSTLKLNQEKSNQDVVAALGMTPGALDNVVIELGKKTLENEKRLSMESDALDARIGTSFLDNPFAWLHNQVDLPSKVAKYNAEVQGQARAIDVMQRVGVLADSQIARNNAVAATINADIIRLQEDKGLQIAKLKVAAAEFEVKKQGIELGNLKLATTKEAFSAMTQLYGAQVQQQHMELSREGLEEQKKMRQLQARQLQLAFDERTEKLEQRAVIAARLEEIGPAFGININMKTFEMLGANNPLRHALESAIIDPNINSHSLGSTTAMAVDTVNRTNLPLNAGTQQQTMEYLRSIQSEEDAIQKATLGAAWEKMKPEQRALAYDKRFRAEFLKSARNIPDSGNWYSAPPLTAMNEIPAVASTEVMKILAPLAKDPRVPLRAQQVWDTSLQLVADGKLSIDAALQQQAQIYQTANQINAQNTGLQKLKIPMLPVDMYNTSLTTVPGIMSTKEIVNPANPTAAKPFFLRALNAKMVNDVRQGAPGGVMGF